MIQKRLPVAKVGAAWSRPHLANGGSTTLLTVHPLLIGAGEGSDIHFDHFSS